MRERWVQNGKMDGVEADIRFGSVLQINHRPPVNLLFASRKTLPVKVIYIVLKELG